LWIDSVAEHNARPATSRHACLTPESVTGHYGGILLWAVWLVHHLTDWTWI